MSMRLWVGMLIACAVFSVALSIANLGASVHAHTEPESAPAAPQSSIPAKSYDGVVTDTHCGAKHSAAIGETAGDCTRLCVHAGERFALVDGDQMYMLEGGSEALKRVAGERVGIFGTLNGNTISVVAVRTH